MLDFELSEEDLRFQKWVRDFTANEITPLALKFEDDKEGGLADEIFEKAAKIGLLSLPIPEEYGGGGGSSIQTNIALEELAVGCGGISCAIGASWFGMTPILMAGTKEQHDLFLPPLASTDKANLCCMAMTEHQGGSDIEDHRMHGTTISTKVRADGDYYIVSGRKMWPSNAGISHLYTVVATVDATQGDAGSCVIVVPEDTPGLSFGKPEWKMGMHADRNSEIIFDDCRLPRNHLLGEIGRGTAILQRTLTYNRGGAGAISLGMARGAFEKALAYCKERIVGGKPLIEHELIAAMFADMAIQIEAARLLILRAAWYNSQRGKRSLKWATMAKVYASDIAMTVTSNCIEVMGSYGYSRDAGVEKYMRDAKIVQIFIGANELCRQTIGEELAAKGPWLP